MEIFTGYYHKIELYIAYGYTPVAITKTYPKDVDETLLAFIEELNPPWWMIKKEEREYRAAYGKLLSKLNPIKIANRCKKISKDYGSKGVVLLGWENSNKFGHRKLIAKWLKKGTRYKVKEYLTNQDPTIKIDISKLTDD